MIRKTIIVLLLIFCFSEGVIANDYNAIKDGDVYAIIQFAQWEMHKGQWDKAISILKKGVAKYPRNNVLRLQLAISLFKNEEFDDSLEQLIRVKSTETDELIVSRIDNYIKVIRGKQKTLYNIHLSYETDANVYSTPSGNFGGWRFKPPVKDNYINYYLSASNVLPVYKGYGFRIDGYSYGKKYRRYNEFDRNVSGVKIGPSYHDGNLMMYAQSGFELYNSNEEQRRLLVSAYISNLLGKDKKVDLFIESKFGSDKHKELLGSLGGFYFISPWSYLRSSLGLRLDCHDNQMIRKRFFNFYWGYDWDSGISSIVGLSGSYQDGNYRGFWGISPRAIEISPDITLWYRGISFFEFVPKLRVSYIESHSDHPLYNFNKMVYSVFISKTI